jgi:hypothetical protein
MMVKVKAQVHNPGESALNNRNRDVNMTNSLKMGFLVFALLSLLGCVTTKPEPVVQNGVSGEWFGKINVPEQELYIRIELAQKAGSWTGSIDIPQQRLTGLPLTDISVDGTAVGFGMLEIPGEPFFHGRLADGRISGEYHQGGNSNAFYLGREPLDIPGMIAPEEAARIIDAQLAAFNAHDLEAFIAFFHPDIETYRFPNEPDKHGLEALRDVFADTFKALPHEKVITRIIDGNHVIDQVEVTFQFHGHALSDRSTVIYTLEDGLIRRMRFL